MIIKRLKMHNFGVYASDNEYVFKNKKPIVLVGGLNGRGKTTLLEAVLLALYGSNSFAYKESDYQSYGRYLNSYVNTLDQTFNTFVELEFLMTDTNDTYTIRRSWNGEQKRTKENILVCKNGERSTFLTNNWSMFIEGILPSALSKFFFFDGEKIAVLAEQDTTEELKLSIETMLGITTLDMLNRDIQRIIKRSENKSDQMIDYKKIDLLKNKRDQANEALSQQDERINELKENIVHDGKILEELETKYEQEGSEVVSRRDDTNEKLNNETAELKKINNELYDEAASELPLMMVKNLLSKANKVVIEEQKSKMMEETSKQLSYFYHQFINSNKNSKEVSDFMNFVNDQVTKKKVESVYNLSDISILNMTELVDHKLKNAALHTKRLLVEQHYKQSQINELRDEISVEVNEAQLTKILKKMIKLEQKIEDSKKQLKELEDSRVRFHGEARKANAEFNVYVESVLGKLELSDDNNRLIKYANLATKVLKKYKIRLQERKIEKLAETMTQCYKRLADKRSLIDRILVDATTLDFTYLNSKQEEVSRKSLSAGEKQLMIISLLWALAICSKRKLPVIIDTPLARLDSKHRETLVKTYFPNASDQTIILSTDSEIIGRYYEMIKPNVGDEFHLVYHEETKSTSIEEGYFKETKL